MSRVCGVSECPAKVGHFGLVRGCAGEVSCEPHALLVSPSRLVRGLGVAGWHCKVGPSWSCWTVVGRGGVVVCSALARLSLSILSPHSSVCASLSGWTDETQENENASQVASTVLGTDHPLNHVAACVDLNSRVK
eukprot:CAMPEP_0114553084 /NCGR_PEP_ID=MMETSP0114-20121206/7466_1 /TAXON_ID=31324 /ORGANISM="Goniomonas sp, Strain m" /LENGTH=134 /DNA_ID=CAMNT_0001737997 /DNA_START=262 /DNA_END=663 /DNA_ORIENTATION=+